jgi:endonuclease/exonuclease/phosphatase family metal-dependent hydrolase
MNTYIHPSTASTKGSRDFLEEIDQLGDAIVMCGDFNARSSMWDQQGNNPQGKALEEALGDVMFDPVTTLLPTHLGS